MYAIISVIQSHWGYSFSIDPIAIVSPIGLGAAGRFRNRIDLWAGSVLP